MKSITVCSFFLFCLGSGVLRAQTYVPADNGSSITFTIKNLGFNVEGSFKNLQGNIHFDPNNLKNAIFKVTVDAATVTTGNNSRDSHLKKEEYFDAGKFPKILFLSDKIDKGGEAGMYTVNGRFTIKGKTKPVTIPFTAVPQNNGLLFTGKLALNRRDFEVGGNSFVLSDNLLVKISVFAKGTP